jgi:hypothetical protein
MPIERRDRARLGGWDLTARDHRLMKDRVLILTGELLNIPLGREGNRVMSAVGPFATVPISSRKAGFCKNRINRGQAIGVRSV